MCRGPFISSQLSALCWAASRLFSAAQRPSDFDDFDLMAAPVS